MNLRGPGRPLVIAHRVETEEEIADSAADIVELDVSPGLVVAHSLGEARHDALSLEAALALVGREVHVDVKLPGYEAEVAAAIAGCGLEDRAFVSSPWHSVLRRFADLAPHLPRALSYPHDRYGVSSLRWPQRMSGAGAASLRVVMPVLVAPLARRAGATALSLHHTVCSPATVAAAHRRDLPVISWTVNAPADVRRLAAAGVDAIVTDEPGMALATLTAP